MKSNLADDDFEDVSALIKKEEEDALAFFRTGNFKQRLEIRLREIPGDKRQAFPFWRMAVPVLALVLVVIMAGIFFFIRKRPGAVPPSERTALAAALRQLPGFSHPPAWEWTAAPGQTGTSRLAESVRLVLVAAEQIKKEEERRVSIPAGTGKVPRLSLDQKMEILFKERVIERALLLIKDDSKEV